MSTVAYYCGRQIRIEAGATSHRAHVRYHAQIDGQAVVNRRGAMRTWKTREAALHACMGLVEGQRLLSIAQRAVRGAK